MVPASASKYDEIILDLNEIAKEFNITPYVFKLNRYKTDATLMVQNDPENSYSILGMISCLESDLEAMHKYHRMALKCSGKSSRSLFQYSSSLYNCDLFEEAYDYAYQAYEKDKRDRATLQILLKLSYYLERNKDYQLFKNELKKRKFEFQDPDQFNEDNEQVLTKMVESAEVLIQAHPELVVEPDPEIEALVAELVKGVDIS